MIDINKTIDLIKLKFYNEWIYAAHVYEEGENTFHKDLTTQMVQKYIDPLNLKKDAKILDLGCGAGYFLEMMKDRGYTDLTGVTLSPGDLKLCQDKGLTVKQYDMSFLPQQDGYYDESVDFIFLRHALEHSPYPIFTLMEYNRVLKQFGKLYIEVPAPDCERKHEYNSNHYSILGQTQLVALLTRTGFNIDLFENVEFDVLDNNSKEQTSYREKYYAIIASKQKPIDVK
jgi:ubiquinone/menaquinone biosynthesis C-methylase UbiE